MSSDINNYLLQILQKYAPRDLSLYYQSIAMLRLKLTSWAGSCFLEILNSGSREKGTAISLASDVDYLISLKSSCNENNGGLKSIYESLFNTLKKDYPNNIRKQNVSIRIEIGNLEIDITPARKLSGNTNYHTLYVSKLDTWKQTNIKKHIDDVSQSGRIKEIKLIKIWRELNKLDFPSTYIEYLIINNILLNKSKDSKNLSDNVAHILTELSKDSGNPLYATIVDPSSSTNIISNLSNGVEKQKIINAAKIAIKSNWGQIFY